MTRLTFNFVFWFTYCIDSSSTAGKIVPIIFIEFTLGLLYIYGYTRLIKDKTRLITIVNNLCQFVSTVLR